MPTSKLKRNAAFPLLIEIKIYLFSINENKDLLFPIQLHRSPEFGHWVRAPAPGLQFCPYPSQLTWGIWGPGSCERGKTALRPFPKATFLKQRDSTQVFLLGTDPVSKDS